MKKLLSFFLTLSLFLVTSCDDGVYEFNVADLVREPELSLDALDGQSTITLSYKEGSYYKSDVTTTTSGITIEASEGSEEWLQIVLADDESRITFITLSENDGEEDRVATIEFTAGKLYLSIKVFQSTYEPDYDLVIYEGVTNTTPLTVGDITPDGKGMVFYVNPNDNTSGKAISLQAVKGSFYADGAGDSFGAKSEFNGMSNTHKFPEEAEAFAYCEELGDHWYMPSYDELLSLFDIYNGASVTMRDETYNSAETALQLVSRKAFEEKLAAAGGDPLNSTWESTATEAGDCIWSSTENQSEYEGIFYAMRYVRFGQYNYDMSMDKNVADQLYYRPMQIIGTHTFTDYLVESYIERIVDTLTYTPLSADAGNKVTVELLSEAANLVISEVETDDNIGSGWITSSITSSITGYTITVRSVTTNYTGAYRTATINVADRIGGATIAVTVMQAASDDVKLTKGAENWPSQFDTEVPANNTQIIEVTMLESLWAQAAVYSSNSNMFTLDNTFYDTTTGILYLTVSSVSSNGNGTNREGYIYLTISDSTMWIPLIQEADLQQGGRE